MKQIIVTIAIALTAAGAASAAQPVPYLPVPKGAAVILNTGSTNTLGYRIVIDSAGRAEYVEGSTRARASVPSAVVAKFFADLRRAMPLSRLHAVPCMKSASFGTATFVWWRGQRSPDISCPGDATSSALMDDVVAVAGALNLSGGHVIHMQPMPGESGKPLPSSTPSASPLGVRLTARAL